VSKAVLCVGVFGKRKKEEKQGRKSEESLGLKKQKRRRLSNNEDERGENMWRSKKKQKIKIK
jgi:hypothetical protein